MSTSVRRNLLWMSLSQGSTFVLQFGGSVAMTRLLSPREMGVYAVAAAVIAVLAMIRAFGLGSLLIRERELTDAVVRTTFTVNAGLAALSSALIAGLSGIAGAAMGDDGVTRIMRLLAVAPLISIFEFLPSACLERAAAFRTLAAVGLLKVAANTATTVALAALGFSYMSIAWGNIATSLLGMACFNILGRRFVDVRPSLLEWRRIGRFGIQMLTISTVASAAGRLSDLMLGRIIGLSALGLYSRAAGLNSLLWDNLHLVIARIVFVDFAEQHRRGLSLRQSYLRIVAMITALLWPAFAGLAILAGPVVRTVYGERWVEAAAPLSMLSIAGILLVAITMTGEVYVVSGEVSTQLRYEAKRTAIGTALFAAGCLGGLVWAAASRIGDAAAAILLAKDDLKRLTDTTAADYPPIYLRSAWLTAVACGPAALVMAANGWSDGTSLPAIAGAVGAGVLGWWVALRRANHPLYLEAMMMRRKMSGFLFSPA